MVNSKKISRRICALLIGAVLASPINGIARMQTGRPDADAVRPRECVILLHGLGRSARSMAAIAATLERRGYAVVNLDYASTRQSLETLAEGVLAPAVARCRRQGYTRIHLVTHSMGGIVARVLLDRHALPPGSRLVMLAPPNGGSELTDWALRHMPRIYHLAGPAADQLGTGEKTIPHSYRPSEVQIGIIAGNRSWNPIFSAILPGDDDGRVAVNRARLAGMRDFLIVPDTHMTILYDRDVHQQIVHFLENGQFNGSQAVPIQK